MKTAKPKTKIKTTKPSPERSRRMPVTKEYIRSHAGFMKTNGKLLKELMREKREEKNG